MKKFLIALAMVCTSVFAFAEASFDQIQNLIDKQQYAAAASGLEGIIHNHPNSAKAFYAMAQAQAGLGNLEKARYALDKARGLDPDLKFASKSNIESLQVAITPQAAKIETVHEHDYAWLKWVLAFGVFGLAIWYYKSEEAKKKEAEARANLKKEAEKDIHSDYHAASPSDKAYMREHNMAPKTEAPKAAPAQSTYVPPAPTYTAPTPSYAPSPTQTVIHHHHDDSSLVTGMMLGQMMGHSDPHHDTTRIVEREIIREVPATQSRDSSWDTPSTPSRSSSWDDDSSSSKSSSWGSSSSSSSSWDSGSSSSSSWGSSDSGSSSSSDSSWD
jgi:uncharacterized membrane protein YgcG